jgi:hypothetical protein
MPRRRIISTLCCVAWLREDRQKWYELKSALLDGLSLAGGRGAGISIGAGISGGLH